MMCGSFSSDECSFRSLCAAPVPENGSHDAALNLYIPCRRRTKLSLITVRFCHAVRCDRRHIWRTAPRVSFHDLLPPFIGLLNAPVLWAFCWLDGFAAVSLQDFQKFFLNGQTAAFVFPEGLMIHSCSHFTTSLLNKSLIPQKAAFCQCGNAAMPAPPHKAPCLLFFVFR